jgi:hypothetical protein
VPDVPDQPIVRRIKDVMESDGELDHAEAGAQMTARHADRIDCLLPEFVGELTKLAIAERAHVGRRLNAIEERRRTV